MAEVFASQKAMLIATVTRTGAVEDCHRELDELARLLETAGGEEAGRTVQVRPTPDAATVIGSGKCAEIADFCEKNGVSLAIFNGELSPAQIRNLEEEMKNVRVIDRSMLILDIFALHAASGEGKLQVELAQLQYTAPRLAGSGKDLSRLGGTIGTRGPGESKLEEDRRYVRKRIQLLKQQLAEMAKNRATMRAARDRSGLAKVAIVGYTNAGKSTLLNALTGAGVLSEDKLFATLDPTTRKLLLPTGETVLLTDTVGLIRNLPHHLVEAFHSTLEEAALADVLVILADFSDKEWEKQLETTYETLKSLGAAGKPTLLVYNKCDLVPGFDPSVLPKKEDTVYISAGKGEGLAAFTDALARLIRMGKKRVTLRFPYEKSGEVNGLYRFGTVEEVTYGEDAIFARAVLDRHGLGLYRPYFAEGEKTDG